MGITNIILLLGGLGAFLFGMKYMGEGLELVAGPKMKDLLEKLTRNPVIGFLIGMLVTVVIQSSSATTVMVMGFINAGIMDLAQATGVIFGANIGTTITSVLIALDVSAIAPVCIAAGAVMMLYGKKKTVKYTGQIILGFGFLFQGLHTMSSSMSPLKDSAFFQSLLLRTSNPFLGFLLGLILCAILQSSSASVGIIQALALQGLMPLSVAACIVCGINVGSSTPPLLSALNARHNAQRAALIYLLFNLVGALIFVPLSLMTPLCSWIESITTSGAFQISFFHILFKVVTGCILLPCVRLVVKLTYIVIPVQEHESQFRLRFLDKNMIGSPAVLTVQVQKEVGRLADLVKENLAASLDGLLHKNMATVHQVEENEEVIDFLTHEISDYLARVNTRELPPRVAEELDMDYRAINDLEQIGDHALNIAIQAEFMSENHYLYSDSAQEELMQVSGMVELMLSDTVHSFMSRGATTEELTETMNMARQAMIMAAKAQASHLERLRQGECTPEQGMSFLDVLNSLCRIVNHATSLERSVLDAEQRARIDANSFDLERTERYFQEGV